MAGRDMKVSVLVQLIDRLTGPLRGITRGISSVGSSIANLGRQIGVVGGALAAISLASPIQQAAAWDAQLRDITITAGKVGGEVEKSIADMSARYQKLAFDTGQSATNVAKGAQTLIASGMDSTLIDKLMPTIARVATATGATIEDTAKTAFSLSDSLKVPAEQMEAMLGKLVVAGKLGRFEFKNMATEFPSLTAQMAKLGITGAEAVEHLGSSLQIAMLGTASPSEAANNLKNFLTKINAPEAIKKFEKELKVDVTGVMTNAAAKGINPVEAVIQKMSDKLKVPQAEIDKIMKKAGTAGGSDKDKEKAVRGQIEQLLAGTKVGKLYADMQVLDFLIPALLNTEKMKDFKRQLKEAGVDVIAQDFASQMRGLKPQLEQLSVLTTAAGNRIGLAFASNIPIAKAALLELLKGVEVVDRAWPGFIDKALSWTGALLAAGAGIAILTPVVSALGAAVALLFSPVVLVTAGIVALAAGAAWLYQNWATVGPQLASLWQGIGEKFSAAWESIRSGQALEGVIAWLGAKIPELATAVINNLPAMVDAGGKLIASIGEGLTAGLIAVTGLGIKIAAEVAAGLVNNLDVLTQAGGRLIGSMTEGVEKKVGELLAWFGGLAGRIIAAIGNIDISSLIKWPTPPAWVTKLFGGGTDQPGATNGVTGAPAPATDPMGNPLGGGFNPTSNMGGSIGGSNGFAKTAAANSNVQVGGKIVVEATEGARVVNVQSTNPAVPVTPNRGAMLGRA